MRELLATNDPVLLSFVVSLLRDAGIEAIVLDRHISVLEGSIGAFPRRVLAADGHLQQARRILTEAGLGQWLVADDAP